jgi:hypothetical protein
MPRKSCPRLRTVAIKGKEFHQVSVPQLGGGRRLRTFKNPEEAKRFYSAVHTFRQNNLLCLEGQAGMRNACAGVKQADTIPALKWLYAGLAPFTRAHGGVQTPETSKETFQECAEFVAVSVRLPLQEIRVQIRA